MFKLARTLSVQDLLTRLDQVSVWQDILNIRVTEGEAFCNPFRKDTSPGCWLSWGSSKNKRYKLVLNDFADGDFHGIDIVDAVMHKYKVGFSAAVEYLTETYKVKESSPILVDNDFVTAQHRKRKIIIIPNEREWRKKDKAYWAKYHISIADLKREGVAPIQYYTVSNGHTNSFKSPKLSYKLPVHISNKEGSNNRFKLYNPSEEGKGRWISNCIPSDLWGNLSGKKTCIITKSFKDYLVIKKMVGDTIDVFAVQNEAMFIPVHFREMFIAKYDEIVLLYDNDDAGIKGAEKNRKAFDSNKVRVVFLESSKDVSDSVETVGYSQARELLLKALQVKDVLEDTEIENEEALEELWKSHKESEKKKN